MGSAGEVEYYTILAGDLGLISDSDRQALMTEVSDVKAVIAGFLRTVEASIAKGER
jgi:four helix bundle protein